MPAHRLYPHVRPHDILTGPILETEFLDPGYPDHSTDVWRVQMAPRTGEPHTVALRIYNAALWNGAFWTALRRFFHWRPTFRRTVPARNRFLQRSGGLPTPGVLSQGRWNGLDYLVMEWMPGQRLRSFSELSPLGLRAYGRHLASIHAQSFDRNGTLAGAKGWPAPQFRLELPILLEMLVQHYPQGQPGEDRLHAAMLEQARHITVEQFAPIMVDLGPGQYLRSEQGELCALVDTDAYVIGPRELDFILLEYWLTPEQARPFLSGYQEVLAPPELGRVRPVYRYLYGRMEVKGPVPLNTWMDQQTIFA